MQMRNGNCEKGYCNSKLVCPKYSQRHHPSLCMEGRTPASDNFVTSESPSSTLSNDQPSSAVSMSSSTNVARVHSRSRWAEFVVGSRPCSEGFSSGSLVFLPP